MNKPRLRKTGNHWVCSSNTHKACGINQYSAYRIWLDLTINNRKPASISLRMFNNVTSTLNSSIESSIARRLDGNLKNE